MLNTVIIFRLLLISNDFGVALPMAWPPRRRKEGIIMSKPTISDDLDKRLVRYENALDALEKISDKSSSAKPIILELLVARDEVHEFFRQTDDVDKPSIKRLSEADKTLEVLDGRLRDKGAFIAASVSLKKWRRRFDPPEEAWWWFFSVSASPRDRFDWVLKALTVGVLGLSASYMHNIYKAISIGDASITTTFSTIAQAGGLALIGGGALSETGQKWIQKILVSLRIPPIFFAEVTFGLSLILLLSVFSANYLLDDLYFDSGVKSYKAGMLANAATAYKQGKKINPDYLEFNKRLGQVYESLGSLDKAASFYQLSVQEGHYDALNDLGRTSINLLNPITERPDPAMAEGILLLGLQRAQTRKADAKLRYELNRNIGWALLNQKKYDRAERYLVHAVELDKQIEINQPGGGMAYCFLARVHEARGDDEAAGPLWQKCIDHARPEFIHEYRWFMEVKQDRIAYCVDTRFVVSGYAGKRSEKALELCTTIREEVGQ